MVATDLKSELKSLMEKRSALETEMNVIIERLCQPGGPGLSGNLVDSETTSNTNTPITDMTLRTILGKDKLNGINFQDWSRNLRIVLRYEKKGYVIEGPVVEAPASDAGRAAREAYDKHMNDSSEVARLMLATMTSNLHKNLKHMVSYEMICRLKEMFQKPVGQERFELVKALCSHKMQEGQSVSSYVLTMKSYIDQLGRLGFPLRQEIATDIILISLTSSFDQFVVNYLMNNMDKSIMELHSMLKSAETIIVKFKPAPVLAIKEGRVKKNRKRFPHKGKGKSKVGKSRS